MATRLRWVTIADITFPLSPAGGPKEAPESDPDEDNGYHEQEYATPAIAPPGQSFDPALNRF